MNQPVHEDGSIWGLRGCWLLGTDTISIQKKMSSEHLQSMGVVVHTDHAIYSPDIVFQRGKDVVKADVLTCAAPNFSAASKYQHVSRQENEVSLLNRVRFLLLIAKEQKPDVLILGAFGCGVFGQDPDVIAKMLHEEVQRLCPAKKVVYAVPGEKSEENLKAFRKNIR